MERGVTAREGAAPPPHGASRQALRASASACLAGLQKMHSGRFGHAGGTRSPGARTYIATAGDPLHAWHIFAPVAFPHARKEFRSFQQPFLFWVVYIPPALPQIF